MHIRPIVVALMVVAMTTPALTHPAPAAAGFGPSTVTALSVTDPVDVYWGQGEVTVEVTASDPVGIASVDVDFTTPDGKYSFSNPGDSPVVSSTETTMTATETMTVDKMYQGTWKLEIDIVNEAGHSSQLLRADLEALGVPGSFEVVDGAPGTPGLPTDVAAAPYDTPDDRDGTAVISWNPPTSGAKVTSYGIVASPGGITRILSGSDRYGVPITSALFPGLTNGVPYTFTVTARNGTTPGETTPPSNSVTTYDLPLPPANVTATGGLHSATVSWTAVTDTGGHPPVKAYRVWPSKGSSGPVPVEVSSSETSATITGLAAGSGHQFRVSAITDDDVESPWSASSPAVTVAGPVPGAPGQVTGHTSSGTAYLSWTAPSVDAGGLTGYTITANPGGKTLAVPSGETWATFKGLTNGIDYTFTVTASNQWGPSAPSEPSEVMRPLPPPDAPANVTVTVGDGRARVSWDAPASGTPVSHYTVQTYGQQKCVTVELTCLVTGLDNGEVYTFEVRAHSNGWDSTGSYTGPYYTSPVDTAIIGRSASNGWQLSSTVAFTTSSNHQPWTLGTCTLTDVTTGSRVAPASCAANRSTWAGVRPGTYRATLAARNSLGQTDTTPAIAEFTVPRPSTQLANGAGWTRRTGSAYYAGRYSQATRRGATITTSIVRARRVALIATRAPGAGSVDLYLGARRIATVRLAASRARTRQIIPVAIWSTARTGTLRIVVTSNAKPVKIEGLGVFTPSR